MSRGAAEREMHGYPYEPCLNNHSITIGLPREANVMVE